MTLSNSEPDLSGVRPRRPGRSQTGRPASTLFLPPSTGASAPSGWEAEPAPSPIISQPDRDEVKVGVVGRMRYPRTAVIVQRELTHANGKSSGRSHIGRIDAGGTNESAQERTRSSPRRVQTRLRRTLAGKRKAARQGAPRRHPAHPWARERGRARPDVDLDVRLPDQGDPAGPASPARRHRLLT